jgi:tetratricopeptide (TPR) repeat protein
VRGRARLGLSLAALAAGLAAAGAILHAREASYPLPVPTQHLLYLRSSRVASRMMLSFKSVAADVYWIRAIQHYGRERKSLRTTDRFDLLQPLLDLTTTLDPRFNIAYRFGAIFLSLEPPNGPARIDQAVALLQKGLAYNPDRWQYAHDIGFIEYWYTRDYVAAAHWFDQAARIPGAPDWIRPLAAVTLAQGGDRQGARTMLNELRGSEERYIRAAAERGLLQLQAMDAIDELQGLIDGYFARMHAYPTSWADLFGKRVPGDPAGVPFVYDPATHAVTVAPGSPLNPMPKALKKK